MFDSYYLFTFSREPANQGTQKNDLKWKEIQNNATLQGLKLAKHGEKNITKSR